jgi:hypothetical protein
MAPGQLPHIETERLLLREPTSADLEAWVGSVWADPDVMRYLCVRCVFSTRYTNSLQAISGMDAILSGCENQIAHLDATCVRCI